MKTFNFFLTYIFICAGVLYSCSGNSHSQSYYQDGKLYVINSKQQLLARTHVDLGFNDPEISQSEKDGFLTVSVSQHGDTTTCDFLCIVNLETNDMVVKIKGRNYLLGSPKLETVSKDKKLFVFTGISDKLTKNFQVIDSNSKIVKKGFYVPGVDQGELVWISGNFFYYFAPDKDTTSINSDYICLRKIYWSPGYGDKPTTETKTVKIRG